MGVFYNIDAGILLGFALGVGCALAVFYAILFRWLSEGGRARGLQQQKPKRYLEEMAAAIKRADKEKAEKERARSS